jgi:hypothetical protein
MICSDRSRKKTRIDKAAEQKVSDPAPKAYRDTPPDTDCLLQRAGRDAQLAEFSPARSLRWVGAVFALCRLAVPTWKEAFVAIN